MRRYFCIMITAIFLLQPFGALAAPPAEPGRAIMNPERILADAVEMARQGNPKEALPILKGLVDKFPDQDLYIFNYTVVLIWAERQSEALAVYETSIKPKANVPAWLQQMIAQVYYRTGQYQKALALFTALVNSGDRPSLIDQADTLIQLGQSKDGETLFINLANTLEPNSEAWSALLLRRGAAWERKGDMTQAAGYYEDAFAAMLARAASPADKKDVTLTAIRTFTRIQNFAAVEKWSAPYTKGADKDVTIQSEYIFAKRMQGKHKEVVAEGRALWPSYDTVPAQGLQAWGDSYFLLGQYSQAIPLYTAALVKAPSLYWAQLARAFAFIQVGKVKEGLDDYALVLKNQPALAETVANDGVNLVRTGRHLAADSLFKLIIATAGESTSIRRMYADSLLSAGLPREAYVQYKAMVALPDGRTTGEAGMARAAVMIGDTGTAKALIDGLPNDTAKNPAVAQAQGDYNGRNRGELEATYSYGKNHQQQTSQLWLAGGYVNLGDGVQGSWEQRSLRLKEPGSSATLNSAGVGFAKSWLNDQLNFKLVQFWAGQDMTGYRATWYHYLNDHTYFSLATRKGPLEDVQSIPAGLTLTTYDFAVERIIGDRDKVTTTFSTGKISDSNRITGYSVNWDHLWMANAARSVNSSLFASRMGFKDQLIDGAATVYDSPEQRDRFGTTLSHRWIYGTHYWQLNGTAAWERDKPSSFEFAPGIRLEYGVYFTPSRALIIGAEYGLYSPTNQGGLYYGARQYDLIYRANW